MVRAGYLRVTDCGGVKKNQRKYKGGGHVHLTKRKLRLIKNTFSKVKVTQKIKEQEAWEVIMSAGKINPLQIDVILDVLFKQLPIEELTKCRLVCTHWNSVICDYLKKSWKDLKIIDLSKESKVTKFQQKMHNSKNPEIFGGFKLSVDEGLCGLRRKFFEDHQTKLLKLQLKYRGRAYNPHLFKYKKTDIGELATVLWYSAAYLRELHIEDAKDLIFSKNETNYEKLINFVFPVLEKVSIRLPNHDSEKKNDSKMILLEILHEICRKSPQLKSISLENAPLLNSSVLDFMKECQILPKLKEFGIHFEQLPYNHGIKLWEKNSIGLLNLIEMTNFGLRLQILSLKFSKIRSSYSTIQEDFKILEEFLQSQAQDLEILDLELSIVDIDDIPENHYKFKMPNFEKLKKLTLRQRDRHLKYLPFERINVQNKFPALKEITLVFWEGIKWTDVFTGCLETVSSVRVNCCTKINARYAVSSYSINRNHYPLQKIFPNVKKFEVEEKDIINSKGKHPWENTLEILIISTIYYQDLDDLDLSMFEQFKALKRMELYHYDISSLDRSLLCSNFNLEAFNKLNLKSFKVHSFKLSEPVVEKIGKKCVFDYRPYRSPPEADTNFQSEYLSQDQYKLYLEKLYAE